MAVSRRTAVAWLAALPLCAAHGASALTTASKEPHRMYGLIGKMRALPGQRDALIAILLEGTTGMPGCLSYVIAKDKADPDALWITEAWESQERHKASLGLASVQAAIGKGRPLIAGFGERFETEPVGGQGLAR
jgi:quinol monooxygenase YgiN